MTGEPRFSKRRLAVSVIVFFVICVTFLIYFKYISPSKESFDRVSWFCFWAVALTMGSDIARILLNYMTKRKLRVDSPIPIVGAVCLFAFVPISMMLDFGIYLAYLVLAADFLVYLVFFLFSPFVIGWRRKVTRDKPGPKSVRKTRTRLSILTGLFPVCVPNLMRLTRF
jgi:hypothetical protein